MYRRNAAKAISLIPPYHTKRTRIGLVEITLFNVICDMDLRYSNWRGLFDSYNEPLRVWPGEWEFK